MSKKFNYYKDEVDYTWYDSSNVIYSECIDNKDDMKTLRVVFSNGTMYEYSGVHVMDYLVFREDASQGRALNRLIKDKGYEYKKLDSPDISSINERLEFIVSGGIYLENTEDGFKVKSAIGDVLYEHSEKLNDDIIDIITSILRSINIKYKL